MANLVPFNIQYEKIVKTYGVAMNSEEELFKNKYDKKFIYSATLWADADCEFVGYTNGVISSIRLKANQEVSVEHFNPWSELKIKAPIGTNYDILLGL